MKKVYLAQRPVDVVEVDHITHTNLLVNWRSGASTRYAIEAEENHTDLMSAWLGAALRGDRLVRTGNKLANFAGSLGVRLSDITSFVFNYREGNSLFTYVFIADVSTNTPPNGRTHRGCVTTKTAVVDGGVRIMTVARG